MSQIRVTLNKPRRELVRDGFYQTIQGHAIEAVGGLDGGAPWDVRYGQRFRMVPLPEGFVREPTTGIVMLRPRFATRGAFNIETSGKMTLAKWRHTNSIAEVNESLATRLTMSGASPAAALIEGLVDVAIATIFADMAAPLETLEPLHTNQGWAIVVDSPSTSFRPPKDVLVVQFGQRFHLRVGSNGTVSLLYRFGAPGTDPEVIWEKSYSTIRPGKAGAFTISMIPFGISYLQINVSAGVAAEVQHSKRPGIGSTSQSATVVDLLSLGVECPLDTSIQQNVKVPAGAMQVLLPKAGFQSVMAVFKAYYEEDSFLANPVFLDEPPVTEVPQVIPYGYYGVEATQPEIRVDAYGNTSPTPFDPATDTILVPRFNFIPAGPGNSLTPEMHWFDVELPPLTELSAWTPKDVTDKVSYCRFQLTRRMQGTRAEIKLHDQPIKRILQRGGPVEITHKDPAGVERIVWEGQITDRETTIKGSSPRVLEELSCVDLLESRVNRMAMMGLTLTDRNLGWLIGKLLNRAGFLDDEIEIDPRLKEIDLDDYTTTEDIQQIASDAMILDVLQDVQRFYGLQLHNEIALRRRIIGGVPKWHAYLDPLFNPATDTPDAVFFADESLITLYEGGSPGPYNYTDTERYAKEVPLMKITDSELAFTTRQQKFNQLFVRAQTGATSKPEAAEITISVDEKAVLGRGVADPEENIDFEGYVRTDYITPPKAIAASEGRWMAWARMHFDREQRRNRFLGFVGEWQTPIEPDQKILVLGRGPDGQPVNYGVWRIDSIDVEIKRMASGTGYDSSKWASYGSYSLIYEAEFPVAGFTGWRTLE